MTTTTTTKQIGYAYPTSDTAGRLGFGKDGCYFCRILTGGRGWSRRDRGFATEAEAINYAERQPETYDHFSIRPDGAKPWMTYSNQDIDREQGRLLEATRAASGWKVTA